MPDILYTDSASKILLLMDKKEAGALVEIMAAALAGKKLNKQSNAFKLATKLDNELPIF